MYLNFFEILVYYASSLLVTAFVIPREIGTYD